MNAKEYRVVILVLQLTSYGTLELSSMEQHVEKVLVAVYSQNDENLEQNESQTFWSIFSFIFFHFDLLLRLWQSTLCGSVLLAPALNHCNLGSLVSSPS